MSVATIATDAAIYARLDAVVQLSPCRNGPVAFLAIQPQQY